MTLVDSKRMQRTTNPAATPPEQNGASPIREIRYEYSRALPPLLTQLGVSLLMSTYQAGKVVAVGVVEGEPTLSYHNFERAMGLAVKPDCIAVGSRAQVWFLRSAPDLAATLDSRRFVDAPGHPRSVYW